MSRALSLKPQSSAARVLDLGALPASCRCVRPDRLNSAPVTNMRTNFPGALLATIDVNTTTVLLSRQHLNGHGGSFW